jgi:hypothetical protein
VLLRKHSVTIINQNAFPILILIIYTMSAKVVSSEKKITSEVKEKPVRLSTRLLSTSRAKPHLAPHKSPVRVCPVETAIQSLYNTAEYVPVTATDSKAEAKFRPIFDVGVIGVMKSMLSTKVYDFRLSKQFAITAGTGTIATAISHNLTLYNEGSALLALFDECKLVTLDAELALANNTGGQIVVLVGIETVVNTSTSTASAISRLPNSQLFSTYDSISYSIPSRHVVLKCPGRPYGETVDEGVSSPRIATGLNATFRMCEATASQTPVTSLTYFACVWRTHAKFRARA